ncbi:MAG: hypothetical protein QF921_10960 [Pseudomonadales bacterium]|nr:hypothetical protein [Pseudomonadales bacterium]MDP6972009.1 hypothetical protein [Pseudomonadales bacterium]
MAYRIVVLQLVAVFVAASVMSLVGAGQVEAALLAGVVCVVPTALFAHLSANTRHAARLIGQGVGKMVLTVVLMAIAFAAFRPQAFGFFATLVVAQAAYVVAPLVWRGQN